MIVASRCADGVVAVRAPGRGITEPGRQAGLVEQARRLLHEFVEIPEGQYFLTDREQVGNGRAELGEHGGTGACGFEEPRVHPGSPLPDAGC